MHVKIPSFSPQFRLASLDKQHIILQAKRRGLAVVQHQVVTPQAYGDIQQSPRGGRVDGACPCRDMVVSPLANALYTYP